MAKKIAASYVCKKCGDCCNEFEMFLSPEDPGTGRTALNILSSVGSAFEVSYKSISAVSAKVYGECQAFDDKSKRCRMYKIRPMRCKQHYCRRYRRGEKTKK
ncbi:hypothetical protein LCGC14_0619910 [marine sediment metagenome]|uniref:YkgJ family cysteine cluster protein n=1 Tax=marine sediment metagenome TaxID=412755 RepID=A0A0F9RA32_9ZZZZ